MQTQNPIFDQLARLMTDAASAANGVKDEAEVVFRRQIERLLAEMDLAPREELEAVRDMASAARVENEILRNRLDELERRLADLDGAVKGTLISQPSETD